MQAVAIVLTRDVLLKVQLVGLPVEFSPTDQTLGLREYTPQVSTVREISS